MSADGSEGDDSALKKRMRNSDDDDEKSGKNRGNYRCGKCNLPKKGHVCPHSIRFKRRDQVIAEKISPNVAKIGHEIGCQVELDDQMTLRMLPLELQGYPESYGVFTSGTVPTFHLSGAPINPK